MIALDNCPGFSSDELLLCLTLLLGERVLQVDRHAIGHPWTAAKLLSHFGKNMKSLTKPPSVASDLLRNMS